MNSLFYLLHLKITRVVLRYHRLIKSRVARYLQTARGADYLAEVLRALIVTYQCIRHPVRLVCLLFQSTAVYTSTTGGYDPPSRAKKQLLNTHYIGFFDFEATPFETNGWICIKARSTDNKMSNRLRAKRYKVCPSQFEELANYDNRIWIDGSMRVNSSLFSLYVLLQTKGLGLLPHPDRNSIAAEAIYSSNMKKYENIREEIIAYGDAWSRLVRKDDHLFACGLIAYRDLYPSLESLWWSCCVECEKDQISFPYVIDQVNIEVSKLSRDLVRYGFLIIDHSHRIDGYELV